MPQLVQDIITRLFCGTYIDIKYFKIQYDPDEKEKERKYFMPFIKKKNSFDYQKDYQRETPREAKEKEDFEL